MQLIPQISLFGGLFALILALGQLFIKRKLFKNYLLALILFSLSFIQISSSNLISGYYFSLNFLNYYYIPFIFFLGPAMYILFFVAASENYRFRRRNFLLFAPGIFLLLALPLSDIVFPPFFQRPAFDYFFKDDVKALLGENLMLLGFFTNIIYFILILKRGFPVIKFSLKQKEFPVFSFYLIIITSLIITISAFSSYFLANLKLIYLSSASITFLLLIVFFLSQRYPHFFQDLETAIRNAKYQKSQLKGLDLEQIKEQLQALMQTEKYYLNENVNLTFLAEKLDLSPHQLSEFINRYLHTNFSGFINNYRIEEAKRLLLMHPESSVLSIAYKVGFNSKSAFHSAFTKQTDLNPSAYQKKFLIKK